MVKLATRIRQVASAAVGLAAASAGAVPPPVEVSPVVVAAEGDLVRDLSALIDALGANGHFSATPADPALIPSACALDDPERERCFAEAARESEVANLVYVVAEPAAESRTRISCIAQDSARSRQEELSVAIATAEDAQAALQERSALSRCIIGALHAPPRG